jgi:hypothetical protein
MHDVEQGSEMRGWAAPVHAREHEGAGRRAWAVCVRRGGAGRENMREREMAGGSHGGFVYFGVGASRTRNQALGRPAYEWEKNRIAFSFFSLFFASTLSFSFYFNLSSYLRACFTRLLINTEINIDSSMMQASNFSRILFYYPKNLYIYIIK